MVLNGWKRFLRDPHGLARAAPLWLSTLSCSRDAGGFHIRFLWPKASREQLKVCRLTDLFEVASLIVSP